MEYRLYRRIYDIVTALGKTHAFARKRFADAWIVLTLAWAVLHDRPISWACAAENWPDAEAWHALPSNATMSRRLRTVGVLTLMAQAESAVRDWFPRGLFKMVDAKPLPVGGASGDADAKPGRAARGTAVGYKLHLACDLRGGDGGGPVDAWSLAQMSTNEKDVAVDRLIGRLPPFCYLAADNEYDSSRVFDATAAAGGQLLVNPRKKAPAGLGHRRQSPHRLRGLALAAAADPLAKCGGGAGDGRLGRALLRARGAIERRLGAWVSAAGGLGSLPAWVRRPRRVARWIWGKLLIYHVRLAERQGLIA
jgi:hypothetical protein